MDKKEQWSFTVIRSKGLHLLRPERSWRPIVCITVSDKSQRNGEDMVYETTLGLDGQNPNQKEVFILGPNACDTSKLNIQVFYQPPGKKKVKRTKRVPVACSHSSLNLGDLIAKQDGHREKKHAQLRLQAQSSSKRSKKKNDADCEPAVLYVKVQRPHVEVIQREEIFSEDDEGLSSHHPADTITDHETIFTEPPSPLTEIHTTGVDVHAGGNTMSKRKKTKKVKGFLDDEEMSVTCSSSDDSDLDEGYDSTLDKAVDWDKEADTTLTPEQEKERWPWIIRISGISAMLDPIIPMHSSRPRGPFITYDGASDQDNDQDPSKITFTASPKPQFAQLKPFTEDGPVPISPPSSAWPSWLWFKLEVFLCAFTLYGELCAAARALDALHEYSNAHPVVDSTPTLPSSSILHGSISSNRSNSFSSFRDWGSSRSTLIDDVEGGRTPPGSFRKLTPGKRFGDTLSVSQFGGEQDFMLEALEKDAKERVEKVHGRLQLEWTYAAGLLAALAAVDTAIFAISSDSIFTVSASARPLVATSSVSSGCGILCVMWFLWWYGYASGVGGESFMTRALDIHTTYISFAVSSRIPAILLGISASALTFFLAVVAYESAPVVVWIVCSGVGVGMGGQFVVWGVVCCVKGLIWAGRKFGRGGKAVWVRLVRSTASVSGSAPATGEVDMQTPVEPDAVADTGRERVK